MFHVVLLWWSYGYVCLPGLLGSEQAVPTRDPPPLHPAGGDAVAFNRALVAFRAGIMQDKIRPWLHSALSKFEAAVPVLLDGLTQGEAP